MVGRRRTTGTVIAALALLLTACPSSDPPEREPVTDPLADADPDRVAAPPYEPPHDRPGPGVDRLLFRAFDVDRAPRDLDAGSMDLYLFSLKTAAADRLRDDERFRLHQAPATTLSLVLNPAPAPEGQLNPFALREVRQAVQYLVDRTFIARDIYRGFALPMVTHVSPQDYDFLTVHDIDRGAGIVHDPDRAEALITAAMEDAGAEQVDGVWHYQGRPVRLTFVGRVEDERREIADLVRAALGDVGFEVAVSYQPFAPAVLRVYSSDPQTLQWHLYTEGWGRAAPVRYDVGTVNQMTAPWLGNMPGWQEVGFWQYEHEELDELGQRLLRGEFTSREERDQIYRRMTELGLEESVRIWLVSAVSHFPARHDLVGVTSDPVAGPRGPWTLREAYLPGDEELTVGHLWVWTERTTWNPVGGFGDVYSVDIWRNLHDPPLWNHPFTGIPRPLRAQYTVETAGPEGSLEVPPDASMWDVDAQAWRNVGAGVTARSRVTFDYGGYVGATWHHGQPITLADAVYDIAQSHALAYDPDRSRIEVALAVTARPYLDTFRGYRVLDDHRLEVFVDYWHFDEDHVAGYASPTSFGMPWEVLYAMDVLVFEERRAAYSDTAAARLNVPWLSLALERDARLVQRALRDLAAGGAVPEETRIGGQDLVGPDEARSRYEAALSWFDTYGHLVISNGPFLLSRYDPPAQFAELLAVRDESYPFRPGDWHFGDAPRVQIQDAEAPPAVTRGEEAAIDVTLAGPGTLGLRYLVLDAASGEVVAVGDAEPAAGDDFTVRLSAEVTRDLTTGLHHLFLAAHSDEVALLSDRRVDLEVR